MNNKHFQGFVSSICGIFGFGGVQINVHWQYDALKFILSMITAILAGALGWVGQEAIKKIYYKYKKQKP